MPGDSRTNIHGKLQQWLQLKRPEASELRLSEFSEAAAGASNETLICDIQWREGDKTLQEPIVARLQSQGIGVFPEYDLDLQYRTMQLMADTGVPVPKLLGYEEDPAILGAPFYLMERIEGRVINENPPYNLDGWFKESTPAERGDMWRNGIRAIAQVNRQDWQSLGFDFLNQPELGATPLQQQLAYYLRFLEWAEAKGRPYPQFHAAYDWLVANQPTDEPVALCWGDAKAANLLFVSGEAVAVLDWEMVHLGNPVDDLAWWLTLDLSQSEGLRHLLGMEVPALSGVPGRRELIELWERESGFSAAELPYYEVFAAFKFSIIMASIGTNMMREGIMPEEMVFDIKNNSTPVFERLMAEQGIAISAPA